MREREESRYEVATGAAEVMCLILEAEYQRGERDLDAMMRPLKDLLAYSLTQAEIMDQREGVELSALGEFFGMTGDSRFRQNRERLKMLFEESIAYQGQAEVIEQEVPARKLKASAEERTKTKGCNLGYSETTGGNKERNQKINSCTEFTSVPITSSAIFIE